MNKSLFSLSIFIIPLAVLLNVSNWMDKASSAPVEFDRIKCWKLSQNPTNTIGSGVLLWTGSENRNMEIYSDSTFSELEFVVDIDDFQDCYVCPFLHKPDYEIFHFIVLEQCKNGFRVQNHSKRTNDLYLKSSKQFEFKTWEDFFTQDVLAIRIDEHTEPMKVLGFQDNEFVLIQENGRERNVQW